jgi:hypothetical protein
MGKYSRTSVADTVVEYLPAWAFGRTDIKYPATLLVKDPLHIAL